MDDEGLTVSVVLPRRWLRAWINFGDVLDLVVFFTLLGFYNSKTFIWGG